MCLYIDNILIVGTDIDAINEVKSFLSQSFDMNDLGDDDVILNINLIKMRMGLLFCNPIILKMFLDFWL